MANPEGTGATDGLLHELAEIRRIARRAPNTPDEVTDRAGRVWTWWEGELYTTPRPDLYPVNEYRKEVGKAALPLHLIDRADNAA